MVLVIENNCNREWEDAFKLMLQTERNIIYKLIMKKRKLVRERERERETKINICFFLDWNLNFISIILIANEHV